MSNKFLIGNSNGEITLLDKDRSVQFKEKVLDGEITTIT